MIYISEKIGDDYKKWDRRDVVFLNSPTGSGKTTFILHTLVPFAAKNATKILYLVNRRILKEQLKKQIDDLSIDKKFCIDLELYQSIENVENFNFQKYEYVVCDEAHYFKVDSLYNAKTSISFSKICNVIGKRTCIFMSATLECIKEDIKSFCSIALFEKRTPIFDYPTSSYAGLQYTTSPSPEHIKEYSCDSSDSYITYNIKQVLKIADMVEIIRDSREKWIIFVDSLGEGKELKKQLKDTTGNSKDVVFLSAKYNDEKTGKQEVEFISDQEKQASRILVCTSVMDNGITLKDIELRNVVIHTSVREEFIQMIGRKRPDNQQTNLYIVCTNYTTIVKRHQIYRRIRDMFDDYYKGLEDLRIGLLKTQDFQKAIYDENNLVSSMHNKYLWKILNSDADDSRLLVQAFYMLYDGRIVVNRLCLERVEELFEFYKNLVNEGQFIDDGEKDFLVSKKQLSWLNYSDESIERLIDDGKKELLERSIEDIRRQFYEQAGKELDKKKYAEFLQKIRTSIRHIGHNVDMLNINGEEMDRLVNKVGRCDKAFGKKNINLLNSILGIEIEETPNYINGNSNNGLANITFYVKK